MELNLKDTLGQITLRPGNMVTVWLDREKEPGKRNAEQIELRVRPDGTREIFANTERMTLQDFRDYKQMEEK